MMILMKYTQEQAEADRDGMRVFEEMVRFADRTEQEITERSRRTEGHESWSTNCDFSPQL